MKPERHIRRLLRWMNRIRNEVVVMHKESHFEYAGVKGLDEVERDIEKVIQETERKQLLDTPVKSNGTK